MAAITNYASCKTMSTYGKQALLQFQHFLM